MKAWHVLLPLLVLGAGAFSVKQQHDQRAEIADLRRQTAALASSVGESQESASHRAQSLLQGLTRAVPAPPATEAAVTERKPAPAGEGAAHREAPSAAEVTTHMEAAFSHEVPDHEWSEKTQVATQEKIGAMMPKDSAVRSVDCRTTLCRVEMSHQSLDDYQHFVRSAYMNPETGVWSGPTFTTLVEQGSDGGLVAVSFLAREGESLPYVE